MGSGGHQVQIGYTDALETPKAFRLTTEWCADKPDPSRTRTRHKLLPKEQIGKLDYGQFVEHAAIVMVQCVEVASKVELNDVIRRCYFELRDRLDQRQQKAKNWPKTSTEALPS